MVVFDTSILLLVLDPNAKPPADPATGAPVPRATARIEYLVDRLDHDREKIIVPTPVLSELLVFRIASFDQKAAIEAALAHRDALRRGGLRIDTANPDAPRTKIKFDWQIVAIASAEGARAVYSDDEDVIGYAKQAGLGAFRTLDPELPPEDPQQALDFGAGNDA